MAVCDKRSSRHLALRWRSERCRGMRSRMQAPFDTVGAMCRRCCWVRDDHGGRQPEDATSQFGNLCWMALLCAERRLLSGKSAARVIPYCRRACLKMNVLPSRPSVDGCSINPEDHLYCAPLPVSRANTATVRGVCPAHFTPLLLGSLLIAPHATVERTRYQPRRYPPGLVIFVGGLILLATLPIDLQCGISAKSWYAGRVWLLSGSQ